MAKKQNNNEDDRDPSVKRLDALIRVILETLYSDKKEKFTETTAIELLNSSGLTPTEIARILGKKGRTAIAPYLYSKDKPKRRKKSTADKNDKPKSD